MPRTLNLRRNVSPATSLRLGFKRDFGSRVTAEGAYTENLKNQQATTDFGVYVAVARLF